MVVPIRDTRNKFFSTLASNIYNSNIALVFNNVDMADDCVVSNIIFNNSNRNDKVRGCTLTPSAVSSRSVLSSSSNKNKKLYLDCMQRESNKMVQDEPTTTSDNLQLEYATSERQTLNVSKMADISPNMRIEYVHNAALTYVNSTTDNNNDTINIQLNYDVNQALDQDLWDSEFRAISLHGSIEHLSSDIKNIKELLSRMEKYILGKGIDGSKANNIKDFEGLGKAA